MPSVVYGETLNRIPELIDKLKDISEKKILAATIVWHRSLVDGILQGQRSGKIYMVPGAKHQQYQASAPGEAPAKRTGALASDYKPRVKTENKQFIGEVGSVYDYARDLETGTSKMAKRPHLKPAYLAAQSKIMAILTKDWKF